MFIYCKYIYRQVTNELLYNARESVPARAIVSEITVISLHSFTYRRLIKTYAHTCPNAQRARPINAGPSTCVSDDITVRSSSACRGDHYDGERIRTLNDADNCELFEKNSFEVNFNISLCRVLASLLAFSSN